MEMQLGKFAATRQSWQRDNIRKVYAEIKGQNPRAGHSRLVEILADRLREDDDALYAAVDYIVTNCEEAQEAYARRARTPAQRQQAQQETRVMVESIKSQITLLNLEMPNGKRMRFCTGEEMGKFGAAYQRIAKKVGKTKMVGSVLNEQEVRALVR